MKKYFIAAAFVAFSTPVLAQQNGIVPGSSPVANPGVAISACSQMGLTGAELSNCQASQAAGPAPGTPAAAIGARHDIPVSPQMTTQAPGTLYDTNGSSPLPGRAVPGTGYAAPTMNGGTTPSGTGYKPPTVGGTSSTPSGTGYTAPSMGH